MFCCFFQAEDGIRDLVRSRGLGDVYKRQGKYCSSCGVEIKMPQLETEEKIILSNAATIIENVLVKLNYDPKLCRKGSNNWSLKAGNSIVTINSVSYTHLRAHETVLDLVCRLLLEKKQK